MNILNEWNTVLIYTFSLGTNTDKQKEREKIKSAGPEGLRATDLCELLQMRKRGQKGEEITQKWSSELR